MSELFAADYPMSVDNRHSNIGRHRMDLIPGLLLFGGLVGVLIWWRYFGGDSD